MVELPPALDENEANSSQPTRSPALALEERLTRREAEIARFVAEGLSNKQIARKATISEATVKIHLQRAYRKLGISIAARSPLWSARRWRVDKDSDEALQAVSG